MNVRSLENDDAKEQQQQRLSKCDRAACDWRKMMVCGRPRSRNSKQHTATRTAASSSRTPHPAAILRRATDSWHSVGGEHDERGGPLTATFLLISRLLPAPLPWRRLQLAPRHFSARNNLGLLLSLRARRGGAEAAGAAAEAEALFRQVMVDEPNHANARYNLARLLWARGDLDVATRLLRAVGSSHGT